MGMNVSREIHVTFDKSKEKEFFKLVKELHEEDRKLTYDPCYSVDMSVEDVFGEWRYELEEIDDKYKVTYFIGENEADDGVFWFRIAPVIDSGSYIDSYTGDNRQYRWKFEDGGFETQWGEVTYGD